MATGNPLPLVEFGIDSTSIRPGFVNPRPISTQVLSDRITNLKLSLSATPALLQSVNKIDPTSKVPFETKPIDLKQSVAGLRPEVKRIHGSKLSLGWFPFPSVSSPCADTFGYLTPAAVRNATQLPFDLPHQALLNQLGALMGDPGRETAITDSTIPAGFTYVGQFVDHDITMDVSSSLEAAADATTIKNMRSPALDLDSVYGRGPGLDPYLYVFPGAGQPPSAVRLALGSNSPSGRGGSAGSAANAGGMTIRTDFDVPRMAGTRTAVIGDPRNDENLIVSQLHHTMLRFHNRVVDLLVIAGFSGDVFVEAKRIATHHYQWAVVNDFLRRVCGSSAIDQALTNVSAPIGSAFRMPVEFAVAAYRMGHSMIRDRYWLNFNFINQPMSDVFAFIRPPRLPVLSNWVIDFNAFFETGFSVPVNNKARRIDSIMSNAMESLPGMSGMMAILAQRNLRRGLALGLPSGQGVAQHFGVPTLTGAQLTAGLPANETALLNSQAGVLLSKTPLWYYVLREASVLQGGNQLGPVGARVVAETFARILKRDASSYLNVTGGFAPMLPSKTAEQFTFADLVNFAGVTQP